MRPPTKPAASSYRRSRKFKITHSTVSRRKLAIFWCHSADKIDFETGTIDLLLAADVINDLLAA